MTPVIDFWEVGYGVEVRRDFANGWLLSTKISGARFCSRDARREEGMVRNDTLGLPARVAGDVWIGEVLRCGRRGKRDD
jgi:hypothetical protein